MTSPSRRVLFDAPALYRIGIHGCLDARWASALAGMAVCANQEQGESTTTLTGELLDQAALLGVLTELYDMGYTLLEVRRLSEPAGNNAASASPPRTRGCSSDM